jgi:hypothetical protein
MAKRSRKSKKNIVQVNPDATINYVTGILTGANNYISGLLEGANQYNAWVQVEMSLEGTEIGEYRPDALRNFLEGFKKFSPNEYNKFMADPYGYLMTLKKTNPDQYASFINQLTKNTNYGRLVNTDEIMIKAGQQYRDQIPTLIKSRNMETGLTILQTYAPNTAKVIDKINGILTSSINYNA